jgi:predicted RNase H-like HicB family nuclease
VKKWYSQKYMPTTTLTYTVRIEPVTDESFCWVLQALPDFRTWADTLEEPLDDAKECIQGLFEELARAGKLLPLDSRTARRLCKGVHVSPFKSK